MMLLFSVVRFNKESNQQITVFTVSETNADF